MIERSGSIPLTNGSGSVSRRPKNTWIRWIRGRIRIRIRNTALKGEARRFLEKSARPPCCASPLQLQLHRVLLLAIWKQIAKFRMNFCRIHLAGQYLFPRDPAPRFIEYSLSSMLKISSYVWDLNWNNSNYPDPNINLYNFLFCCFLSFSLILKFELIQHLAPIFENYFSSWIMFFYILGIRARIKPL
jgi:hypothetical protein